MVSKSVRSVFPQAGLCPAPGKLLGLGRYLWLACAARENLPDCAYHDLIRSSECRASFALGRNDDQRRHTPDWLERLQVCTDGRRSSFCNPAVRLDRPM